MKQTFAFFNFFLLIFLLFSGWTVQAGTYSAKASAYYPSEEGIEGGHKDRDGQPLYSLQQYLRGKAPYVSVSMDAKVFAYGTKIQIPELDTFYARQIEFRVVDTGGHFTGKGTSRIDICTGSKAATRHPLVNGRVHIVVTGR